MGKVNILLPALTPHQRPDSMIRLGFADVANMNAQHAQHAREQNAPLTAQQIAERCAALMWADDAAAQGLGIELVEVGPGTARVAMTVRPDMVNGHGFCHGGFIFTVADCAFSYACNSTNQRTVAAGADISFLAPARLGDRLHGLGRVRQQGGRNGIYDIEVSDQSGRTIALFRGRSARISGHFFDDPSTGNPR